MKTLKDYIVESEQWVESPAAGDNIGIELDDGTLIETWIMEATEDSVLIDATEEIVQVLEQWASLDDVLTEAADYACEEDMDLDEAEYQGRNVPLGKPMAGDVKKFKVYVRDPKSGNVKKVNFGHGGTSAKRAGQKTMRIKKSNPARRRSFRARHNCDNPGSRLKARYWACRSW
jgi:hypothetical protein